MNEILVVAFCAAILILFYWYCHSCGQIKCSDGHQRDVEANYVDNTFSDYAAQTRPYPESGANQGHIQTIYDPYAFSNNERPGSARNKPKTSAHRVLNYNHNSFSHRVSTSNSSLNSPVPNRKIFNRQPLESIINEENVDGQAPIRGENSIPSLVVHQKSRKSIEKNIFVQSFALIGRSDQRYVDLQTIYLNEYELSEDKLIDFHKIFPQIRRGNKGYTEAIALTRRLLPKTNSEAKQEIFALVDQLIKMRENENRKNSQSCKVNHKNGSRCPCSYHKHLHVIKAWKKFKRPN